VDMETARIDSSLSSVVDAALEKWAVVNMDESFLGDQSSVDCRCVVCGRFVLELVDLLYGSSAVLW
jgi:hypothetical protein